MKKGNSSWEKKITKAGITEAGNDGNVSDVVFFKKQKNKKQDFNKMHVFVGEC